MRIAVIALLLTGCSEPRPSECNDPLALCLPDSGKPSSDACDPIMGTGCRSGEKCTWIVDALTPSYAGHVGCAPDGAANLGEACMFGAPGTSGFDNCKAGLVCTDYRGGAGTCAQVCDLETTNCGIVQACTSKHDLFVVDGMAVAGICE